MGFSVSWLGVRGKKYQEVLTELGLLETASREWMPESQVVGTKLPNGWYVIFFNEVSPSALKPEVLRKLSTAAELIACQVEEHSMISTAAGWLEGEELWYVAHDAEDGITNLEFTGKPPLAFAAIRERQMQEQANQQSNVDHVFEVPIQLAQSEVGFRYDDSFDEAESEPFVVLERVA